MGTKADDSTGGSRRADGTLGRRDALKAVVVLAGVPLARPEPAAPVPVRGAGAIAANARDQAFDDGWRFLRGEAEGAERPEFDDVAWRTLDLPHDWSVEDLPPRPADGNGEGALWGTTVLPTRVGPFDTERSQGGRDTGWFVGGTGWYRKRFLAGAIPPGGQVEIVFDGVYMNSDVWLNGRPLGRHPYGYTAFAYDLTPHLRRDGENVLAVRVRNEGRNSRWYSGSGVYRHVWLNATGEIRIPLWGVFVTTPEVSSEKATVKVAVALESRAKSDRDVVVRVRLFDARDRDAGSREARESLAAGGRIEVEQDLTVAAPRMWSLGDPHLYPGRGRSPGGRPTRRSHDGSARDQEARGGRGAGPSNQRRDGQAEGRLSPSRQRPARRLRHRPRGGASRRAHEGERLQRHPNEPQPAVIGVPGRVRPAGDAGDGRGVRPVGAPEERAGLSPLVLRVVATRPRRDGPARPQPSQRHHVEHRERDPRAGAAARRRDRASACRPHQGARRHAAGHRRDQRGARGRGGARPGVPAPRCRRIQLPGAPVRAGSRPSPVTRHGRRRVVPGLRAARMEAGRGARLRHWRLRLDRHGSPGRVVHRERPAERARSPGSGGGTPGPTAGGAAAGAAPVAVAAAGGSGFAWPASGSNISLAFPWFNCYCGDIDLIGEPKPQSYCRRVLWGQSPLEVLVQRPVPDGRSEVISWWGWSDELRSWTWPGCDGRTLKVRAYSSGDQVRLLLNGTEVGVKSVPSATTMMAEFDVPYAPGELRAVALSSGRPIAEQVLRTAGRPARLRLRADRTSIARSRNDLAFVTVEVVDSAGALVPDAVVPVLIGVAGVGELAAAGSANPKDAHSFRRTRPRTFHGRCLAIVRPRGIAGIATVQARADGLAPASLTVRVR